MTDTTITDRAWAATRKGLVELRQRGGRWAIERTHFLGEPVSMLLPPDAQGRMLAALNLGHFGVKLHASHDAGGTWQEVATPSYPEQPKDATGPAWKMVMVWSLERSGGTVWAGSIPGGLFKSDDFGTSWQLVESLWRRDERLEWMGGGYDAPGIHSICPHPTQPGQLLVGISCGGAWTTHDSGATWQLTASGMRADFMPPEMSGNPNIQDAHRIQRCAAEPHVLWCQHHGGIWRSTDNGMQWVEVKGSPLSSFGFAVAAHPRDAGTAWFVPAVADQQRVPVAGAVVVNRTRDGGKSFDTLREGLPQKDSYDLVYRHGLAVAHDGSTLLMGSTTGNLWASGDAGDSWRPVSVHLPMVHGVRFG